MTTPIFNQLESSDSDMADYNDMSKGPSSNLDGLKNILAKNIEDLGMTISQTETLLSFVLADSTPMEKSHEDSSRDMNSPIEGYVNGLIEDIARASRRLNEINSRITL